MLLKTNVKNAFNSLDRVQLLKEVSTTIPDIYHHVQQMYLDVSSLIFIQENKLIVLNSQQGVHQGDLLDPALFSTTIHPTLLEIQKENPKIRILAYLDDVFLLGPPLKVVTALESLRAQFCTVHLEIANSKCEIYCSTTVPNEISSLISIMVKSDGTLA